MMTPCATLVSMAMAIEALFGAVTQKHVQSLSCLFKILGIDLGLGIQREGELVTLWYILQSVGRQSLVLESAWLGFVKGRPCQ